MNTLNTLALFVDFGSTFTKAVLVDLRHPSILSHAQAPTTADTDVTRGLAQALRALNVNRGDWENANHKLACSSAAGGLGLVASGLVEELTSKAATMAALAAGAKVLGTYSHELTTEDIRSIERKKPDIILLAGGTDGGNRQLVLHNANAIAHSGVKASVIVAGNREVVPQALDLLASHGKNAHGVENVMPRVGELNVQPVQEVIRELFTKCITHAKGLDKAERVLDSVVMPTPEAVMRAAEVLSHGTDAEKGWGNIVVIDVGGATTDLYSVAAGRAKNSEAVVRGLPEPVAKRTIEASAGVRASALQILHKVGKKAFLEQATDIFVNAHSSSRFSHDELLHTVEAFANHPQQLPASTLAEVADLTLGRLACRLGITSHAGRMSRVITPEGVRYVQEGKDLRGIRRVIGTGGVISHSANPGLALSGALMQKGEDMTLAPEEAVFYVDRSYMLFAAGLLASINEDASLRMMKRYIICQGERHDMQ